MRLITLLLLTTTVLACESRRDIREYYFPVRDLINTEGKVYAYQNTGTLPGPDTIYWYYLGVDLDTALYLSLTRYAPDFSPQQLSREEVTNDGMRMRELTVFELDSAGISLPNRTDILFDRSFPFYLEDPPAAAGYRLKFASSNTRTTYVSLNRYYRADTTVTILGQQREAIVFDLLGEVSQRDRDEGDISPTFSGYEIYARDLGLVEYYRELGAAGTIGGKLAGRMLMSEFAARQEQVVE